MDYTQNACELEVEKMLKDSMMTLQFLNVCRIVKAKIRIFTGFSDC